MNPRQKPLLDYVCQVVATDESSTSARVRDKLERRLAVSILEILGAQPEAVRAQQQIASGASDKRHLLRWVRAPARARASCLLLVSGRHMWMSTPTIPRPPSQ